MPAETFAVKMMIALDVMAQARLTFLKAATESQNSWG